MFYRKATRGQIYPKSITYRSGVSMTRVTIIVESSTSLLASSLKHVAAKPSPAAPKSARG
jgi:hypothetical protein